MTATRIYADFNGLVAGCCNPQRTAVVLDTFGSLRDLSNAGLVLRVGLPLIAVDESDETEDLEGHGTAQYDWTKRWWVVEFDEAGVRFVPASDRTRVNVFSCIECRRDLQPQFDAGTLSLSGRCPSCGTAILRPFDPPSAE